MVYRWNDYLVPIDLEMVCIVWMWRFYLYTLSFPVSWGWRHKTRICFWFWVYYVCREKGVGCNATALAPIGWIKENQEANVFNDVVAAWRRDVSNTLLGHITLHHHIYIYRVDGGDHLFCWVVYNLNELALIFHSWVSSNSADWEDIYILVVY